MSTIQGTNVIAPVVPFDTNDVFASHLAKYGQGGWRTAEDLNERDSITELRREDLMVCAVREDSYNNSTRGNAFYILDVNHDGSTSTSLLDNNNWIPLDFGGDAEHWVLPPPPRSFYPGNQGERSYDEDFIYICILDNVWKRVAFDFFVDGFDSTSGSTSGILPNGVVPIWCDDDWCYDKVVSNIEGTAGAGTDSNHNLLVTFTDNTQKLIPLGELEHWVLPPPLTTLSPGKEGERSYDDNFFYVCIQDNVWKRVAYDFFVFGSGTAGSGGTFTIPTGAVPIWDNTLKDWNYDFVVEDIETTSGTAGNVLVTYTDKTQKLLEIFSGGTGDNWVLPPPLSSSSTGNEGERSYDNDFLYICVQDDLWKRINLDLFLFSGGTSGSAGGLVLPNGVVPIWNDSSNFFEYGLVVENVSVFSDGTNFINITYTDNSTTSFQLSGGGSSNVDILNDLSDVTISSPLDDQFLRYNGTQWVNETVIINDYTTAGLASSSWVTNNFVDINTFINSTQGIIDQINQLSSIDTLKAPDAYSPNGSYPTTHFGDPIESGDTWRITNNGTLGSVLVNTEDLLIALTDLPLQNGTNFMVVESNRDQATESFMGVAKIATTAEVTAGVNDTNYVTPLKLQSKIDSLPPVNDYTTAGLVYQSVFDEATTGINNTLIDIQNQLNGSSLYTATETRTIVSAGATLTPTTLYSSTAGGSNIIPANSLAVGDTIKTKLRGYLNVSVTGTFAFDVQLGGTSLASVSSVVIAHPKTNTLIELDFEFTVRSIGVSGTVIGQGIIMVSLGSTASPLMVELVQTSPATIDTTSTNLLNYLIDWNSAFTGNINITNAIIEK
jgi:hypothetical protein